MAATGSARPPAIILPAATILLLRDGAEGLEVFMVKRHHQIDFASGALVFPGGKLAAGDGDPDLRALTDGAETLDDQRLGLAACAIREAFEESGVLLARRDGETALLDAEGVARLQDFRKPLDKGELGLVPFLKQQRLRLAADALILFARWITPNMMPKRFDTWFFLAHAPVGQLALHDGREAVDSLWLTPAQAMAETGRWKIIFPTRMNLLKLARSAGADAAIAAARASSIVTVEPFVEQREGGPVLRIQPEAGYGDVAEPLSSIA